MQHILCAFRRGANAEYITKLLGDAQVPLYVLNKRGKIDRTFCNDFMALVNRERPDIIHAYNDTPMIWTRFLLRKNRSIPIICHCGSAAISYPRTRLIERILCRRTDHYVFVSTPTKRIWNSYLHIKCPQHIIYNGIDLATFDSGLSGVSAIETSRSRRPFVLLVVSRLCTQKAIHIAIAAVKILKDREQTDICLYLVGDGPEANELKCLVNLLGISSMVRFEGYKCDVQPYYEQSHIALCTSYNETFGLFLAEAMYNRLVCISANMGGPSEFVKDSVNGFLLAPTEKPTKQNRRRCTGRVYNGHFDRLMPPLEVNPKVLADCIIDIRRRYDELGHLRDKARQTIAENFSMRHYCKGLGDLYHEIGQEKNLVK